MTGTAVAAVVHAVATVLIVAFQLALAAGAPWGRYAMGGRHPGRFPPALRAGALVQAIALAALTLVVLDRAGVLALGWTDGLPWLPWAAVVVAIVSVGLNASTRSAVERRTWFPVAAVLLVTSLVVAAS